MRSLAVILLVLATIPLPSHSQDPAPKFGATTELVLVPVLVQRSGHHVPGLSKDNFVLLQDGRPEQIAVFEEIQAHAAPVSTAAAESFTNVRVEGTPQNLTIIAIDLVGTAPQDQAYLKQELLKFLDSAGKTGESFSLVAITHSGIRVLHDFSDDPESLARALRGERLSHATKEASAGNTTDDARCDTRNGGCGDDQLKNWITLIANQERFAIYRDRVTRIDVLASLQQLAQSLRGLPGRKTLVWASSGVKIFGGIARLVTGLPDVRGLEGGPSTYFSGAGEAMEQNLYTYRLLNSANIAVYPLDARHGANSSYASFAVDRPTGDLKAAAAVAAADDSETTGMFQQIAAATGGKACFNRTDLSTCLREAVRDSQAYYMLGYYARKDTKPGWHPINLKFNGQKVDLRYRGGFLATPFDPAASRLTDLQLAILSPLPYTAVPFRGSLSIGEKKGSRRSVDFALNLLPDAIAIGNTNNQVAFDVVAVVRAAGGSEVAKIAQRIDRKLTTEQLAEVRRNGIHYTNRIELAPGHYGIWFVVRDNSTGKTGSAITALSVQ